jgi:hypothetical protein
MSLKNALHKITSVPRLWRSIPPDALGENFEKLIATHDRGGFAVVECLLAGVSISGVMRANAYTALARHLMKKDDRAGAAQAAREAHVSDPKPYRLKWLVFRLYEAGAVVEASALLDILPPGLSFSGSEARRAEELRREATGKSGSLPAKTSDLLSKLEELRREVKSGADINKRHLKAIGKIRLAPALKGKARENSDTPQYIVTLTSYGERLTKTAPYALASLLAQMEHPDRIILWVAYGDGGIIFNANADVTAIYAELAAKGVEIRYCEDLKSYKKLIPALREFPDDILITADDDCLYPFNWFAQLKATATENPGEIVCHRAHAILVDGEHNPLAYASWRKNVPAEDFAMTPKAAAMLPVGAGGVLYPPHSLDARVFHPTDLCPTAGDIWFWAMAKLAGREFVAVPDGYLKDLVLDEKISKRRYTNNDRCNEQFIGVLEKFPELKEKTLNKITPTILPPEFAKQEFRLREKSMRGEKIRVMFIFNEPAFWSADGLYRLFAADMRFEALIVVVPEIKHTGIPLSDDDVSSIMTNGEIYCKKQMYRHVPGFDIEKNQSIDVGGDFNPDIVIYSRPYMGNMPIRFKMDHLSTALSCYIPYGPMLYDSTNIRAERNVFISPFHQRLWKFFIPTFTLKKEAEAISLGNNVAVNNRTVTGYPRWEGLQTKTASRDNNDIDGKKHIIWAPHHSIYSIGQTNNIYGNDGNGCFHLTFDVMLTIARKYTDYVQFTFKPHPLLPDRLRSFSNWTNEQIAEYYRQWEELPNAQIETGDYVELFLTSDALIHDCISFQVDYLCTGKPQLFLERPGQSNAGRWNDFGNEVYALLYTTQDFPPGIEQFIEKVVFAGNDPMKPQREKYLSENLRSPFGKSASQNMFDAIVHGLGLSDGNSPTEITAEP